MSVLKTIGSVLLIPVYYGVMGISAAGNKLGQLRYRRSHKPTPEELATPGHCPKCGATYVFERQDGRLQCGYCGYKFEPEGEA